MNNIELQERIAEIIFSAESDQDKMTSVLTLIKDQEEDLKQLILKRFADSWRVDTIEDAFSSSEIKCVTEADTNDPDKPVRKSGHVRDGKDL